MPTRPPRSGLERFHPTEAPPDTTTARDQPAFQDLDTVRNAEGLGAIISQRRGNGTVTFALFRFFMRDGKPARTNFIPEKMIALIPALVETVRRRIDEIRTAGQLPFPERRPDLFLDGTEP